MSAAAFSSIVVAHSPQYPCSGVPGPGSFTTNLVSPFWIAWFLFREHRDSRPAVLTSSFSRTDLVAGIAELPFKLALDAIGDVVEHRGRPLKCLCTLVAPLIVLDPQLSVYGAVHEYDDSGQVVLRAGSSQERDTSSCCALSERITDTVGC